MEAFSSRIDGASFEEILRGFQEHREFNIRSHRSTRLSVQGTENGYLKNRAWFAAQKFKEVPEKDRFQYVDHKVWSA